MRYKIISREEIGVGDYWNQNVASFFNSESAIVFCATLPIPAEIVDTLLGITIYRN